MHCMTIMLAAFAVLAQVTLAAACPQICTTSTNVAGTTTTVCRAACPGHTKTTTCTSTTNVGRHDQDRVPPIVTHVAC
jgi:hypothetical protein